MGKIFLATNNLPTINGRDNGIYRQLLIIPFEHIFTVDEQDRGFAEKARRQTARYLKLGFTRLLRMAADRSRTTRQSSGAVEPLKAGYGYGGQVC